LENLTKYPITKKHICNIPRSLIEIRTMSHEESELDLTNAGRKLWLVKVPKFVAKRWEKTPDNVDIGTLALTK